jgi:TonB family protein
VRNSYFLERDFRRIRTRAVITSVALHCLLSIGLVVQQNVITINTAALDQLVFGSSGGGGGEGERDDIIQFGPQAETAKNSSGDEREEESYTRFTLIKIHVYSDADLVKPVPKPPEQPEKKKKIVKKPKPILAENLPTHWHRGSGPGSGGGAGGGSGGGIGKGQGYSIDWGGTGSRRLLSGRLPKYPEGTDKQMAVTLRFSVLPDGTVDAIIPVRKTDEHLESAAMAALKTWRFDPLPSQTDQKTQTGKVTFQFKLEQ